MVRLAIRASRLALVFAAIAVASARQLPPVASSRTPKRDELRGGAITKPWNVRGGATSPALVLKDLGVDLVAAAASAAALSPAVAIIDKSITMAVSGAAPGLGTAFSRNIAAAASAPVAFLASPAYVIIFMVYLVTYITANGIESACAWAGVRDEVPKLIGTTVSNVCACVAKDAQFARIFGAGAPHAVPLGSLALFTARDAATIYFSFVAPAAVAAWLARARLVRADGALNVAQLLCPIGVQVITGPIHLLGLDLYNRADQTVGVANRCAAAFHNYFPVVGARMMRILPAFGIGGIGNRVLRDKLRQVLYELERDHREFKATKAAFETAENTYFTKQAAS